MPMNNDAQLFRKNNDLNRRDAVICLDEYTQKFNWKKINSRILDIGSGDGSVNNILKNYLPENYEILVGCDLSQRMVDYANEHYQDKRTKFITLDIVKQLPIELEESFDHVFSIYTFHWIQKQNEAFTNVYKLLTDTGECFIVFLSYCVTYTAFIEISKTEKWKPFLNNVNEIIPPYHGIQEPDKELTAILKKIGFKYIDVRSKQMVFDYVTPESYKGVIAAINPFTFPNEEVKEDFLNDFIKLSLKMGMLQSDNTLKLHYNLLVVHAKK